MSLNVITKRYNKWTRYWGSNLLLTVGTLLTAFTTTITGFLLTVFPLSLATTVLTTVCIMEYSDRFEGGQQGLAMGVWGSFDSVGGVIGPLLGGALFQYGGIWAVYTGAGILSAWAYFISKDALAKDNFVTLSME